MPSDRFEECFSIAKRMLPRDVKIPWVLMTSEDYEEDDDYEKAMNKPLRIM